MAKNSPSGNTRHLRNSHKLQVKNWRRFQHYGKRNPPWIKLYTAILEDPNFAVLPDAAKGQLVSLWALAARTQNAIPFKLNYLREALNVTGKLYVHELIDAGWLIVASTDASSDASANASNGASSFASPREESSSSLPETRFLAALAPEQRAHWTALLDGWRQGQGYPGGRHAHDADINAGLTDYLADNPTPSFNPQHVRAYVRKAEKNRLDSDGTPASPYFSPAEVQGYDR